MADKPRYYLTTAIAYPNGAPHIGHAYEAIATDAIARFKRLDGYDVFFLTGTDEHGIKMLQTAARRSTHAAATASSATCRASRPWSSGSTARTTISSAPPRSATTAPRQAIWQRMEANGDIYLDKYSGWYSVRDEAYYDEDETRLDEQGERLGPQGTPVEWVEEESYFFRLSAYQDKLLDLYDERPDFVLPKERLNEVVELRARRPAGSLDLAHDLRLGHQGAGQSEARHVCVGRRAHQLHHRRRLSRYRQRRNSAATGRPTCTSSARTSCASTRSIGRRS